MVSIPPKKNGDDLYNADQAVRNFCKSHGKQLDENEHNDLRELLKERASAMSDVLGQEIHSIGESDDV